MNIQLIRKILNKFNLVAQLGKEIHGTVSFYAFKEPQPASEEIFQQLQEDLPPSVLYHPDVLNGPPILYKIFRDYLILNGLEYIANPSIRRTSHNLFNSFYSLESDKQEV